MSKIQLYSDFYTDVYSDEAKYDAREEMFNDDDPENGINHGQWALPEEITDEDVTRHIELTEGDEEYEKKQEIRSYLGEHRYVMKLSNEYLYGYYGRSNSEGYDVKDDIFHGYTGAHEFSVRLTDEDGNLFVDEADHDKNTRAQVRVLTEKGEDLYDDWCESKAPEEFMQMSEYKFVSTLFESDKYSEKPDLARKMWYDVDRWDEIDHTFTIPQLTDEERREKLLKYRPWEKDVVAQSVYDLRMGLLSEADRKEAEDVFSHDSDAKALYFGYDLNGSEERNIADTMLKIASGGADSDTCVRIFKTSAFGNTVSDETANKMATQVTGIMRDFVEKLKNFREAAVPYGEVTKEEK